MDYMTPQNLYAAYSGGRKAYAYINEFKRKVRNKPSRIAYYRGGSVKRPFGTERFTQFGNGKRKRYSDQLSLSKLKDAICPRWNLKTHVCTKSFDSKPGRQQILEHEYMDSETINSYINKSKDVVMGNHIFGQPVVHNAGDSLDPTLLVVVLDLRLSMMCQLSVV